MHVFFLLARLLFNFEYLNYSSRCCAIIKSSFIMCVLFLISLCLTLNLINAKFSWFFWKLLLIHLLFVNMFLIVLVRLVHMPLSLLVSYHATTLQGVLWLVVVYMRGVLFYRKPRPCFWSLRVLWCCSFVLPRVTWTRARIWTLPPFIRLPPLFGVTQIFGRESTVAAANQINAYLFWQQSDILGGNFDWRYYGCCVPLVSII